MTHTYTISGMTCGSCVAKVKSELLKTAEIVSAEVQLASPQATITMNKHISTSRLQEIIHRAGKYTIEEAEAQQGMEEKNEAPANSYFPIYLIFAYITGVSLLVQFAGSGFNTMQWMSQFMAGFFLVFSFFKLMNIRGFAEGYGMYDIIARRWRAWGFIYPFIELALGIAFLTQFEPLLTNLVTLLVMGLSSVGVIQNLLKKSPFQCACLGTIISVPLNKLSLFEDLLMVAMSAGMLAYHIL